MQRGNISGTIFRSHIRSHGTINTSELHTVVEKISIMELVMEPMAQLLGTCLAHRRPGFHADTTKPQNQRNRDPVNAV